MEQMIPEKEVLKLSGKQTLEKMQKEIAINKINFDEFEIYYKKLKEYIELGADDYLQYAISLSNALVLFITKDEEEVFKKQMNEIGNIIANNLRKKIENYKINLSSYYEDMKKAIGTKHIQLNEFCNYCDTLRLAMMAKIDGIDFLDWAETLQGAIITNTKTFEDSAKMLSYMIILGDIIEQLKQNTKSSIKR